MCVIFCLSSYQRLPLPAHTRCLLKHELSARFTLSSLILILDPSFVEVAGKTLTGH